MTNSTDVWELFKDEASSSLFEDEKDLDRWISICAETYEICLSISQAEDSQKSLLELSFLDIHRHIYKDQGGCNWCKKRVYLKMRQWLEQEKSSKTPANKQEMSYPYFISLS